MNTTVNNIESMNNNMINAKAFIVPNAMATPREFGWFDPKDWDRWVENQRPYLKAHGLEPEEMMVQVRVTNDVVDNFSDHWRDYQEKILGKEKQMWKYKGQCPDSFPTHLPLSLLKGKKTGDKITLRREDGLVINIELDQVGYRQFGTFEEVLQKLIDYEKEKQETAMA